MIAHKCDVCGSFYEYTEEGIRVFKVGSLSVKMAFTNTEVYERSGCFHPLDLCPQCVMDAMRQLREGGNVCI